VYHYQPGPFSNTASFKQAAKLFKFGILMKMETLHWLIYGLIVVLVVLITGSLGSDLSIPTPGSWGLITNQVNCPGVRVYLGFEAWVIFLIADC
jgi:multisubunit Na+/H+ antiporter MnhB subunit